jgi:hypothetical protein
MAERKTITERLSGWMSQLFQRPDPHYTAKEAYIRACYHGDEYDLTDAKYNRHVTDMLDDDVRCDLFIDEVMRTVRFKVRMRALHCTCEIPGDLIHRKDELIDRIRQEGYMCHNLRGVVPGLEEEIIFVGWRVYGHS